MSVTRTDGVDRSADVRQVVISADGHCGASIDGYRPYVESALHAEFDAWAADFHDGWGEIGTDGDDKVGVASFGAPINWESGERLAATERQGIAAEVLFPNTAPPFFPSGAVSAAAPGSPPASRRAYELRQAGIRAHNRWLADFCADAPGRRAGVAQVFLSDIDDTVTEIRSCAALGLSAVLLPGDHHQQLQPVFQRRLDPVWAACCDVGLPVGRHGVFVTEPNSPDNSMAAGLIGLVESRFFTQRALGALILSGVFERFADLRFVLTEVGVAWIPDYLAQLDDVVRHARLDGSIPNMFGGAAVQCLSRLPSEYFASNCCVGSFLDDADIEAIGVLGADRVMWGSDFPHHEGTSPFTLEALRANFAHAPESDVDRVLATTAASCYGFDVQQLRGVAERIGPQRSDVRRPLGEAEWPAYPEQTVCMTFRGGPHGRAGGIDDGRS